MNALKAELEELRQAMAAAGPADLRVNIINDPELGLEAFKIPDLDVTRCYEIGPLTQPDNQ
jgi:hypothetical protein